MLGSAIVACRSSIGSLVDNNKLINEDVFVNKNAFQLSTSLISRHKTNLNINVPRM